MTWDEWSVVVLCASVPGGFVAYFVWVQVVERWRLRRERRARGH